MPETVIFDHYQVLTRDDGSLYELGRGAMGITYKAFDTNLRVPVALKVINTATLNSDVARQRFVSEARSAAKLRHRHVASVFHLGAGGDTYFYAMEFIDGETVEALIKRQGPLSPALALRIALQVARALNAAQQHGLVHRDIKPSNLMLVKEDDELVVKVIDFGLATICIPGEGDEEAATSSPSGFVGTPHFASPEQLEDRNIDLRSDIYSLGVTTWYMLAGHPPFSGSLSVVMSQHLTAAPPFERLRGLPEPVLVLLRKMLAKDPAERQQTPAELRQEIEGCLAQISGAASISATISKDEESFATLLDDTQLRSGIGPFETGSVIAERYEITRSLGDSNTGRLFVAWDRSRDCPVRLHVLRREFTEDHALYTQLEREVERLAAIEHQNLFRVYGLESLPDASFLILEATSGFSLMELLRARRELPIEEVLPLLEQIAKGVDFALTSGLRRLDLALHQIHVHFPGVDDAKPFLREPVTQWPAFELKVSPLGITRELAASETWAGGETLIGGSAPVARLGGADARTNYIKAFATVTYELLGGTLLPLGIPGISTARYSPLAPLTEGGNDIVRHGLQTGNYPAAANFVDTLRTAEAAEARRREGPSPYKTTATTLPPRAAGTEPVASPEKTHFPFGFIGGVLSVVAVGALLYFFMRSEGTPPQAGETPAAKTLRATPPPIASTPSPAPSTPEPTPQPTRQDMLRVAVTGAEALEAGADWKRAIGAWLQVAKTYPESEIGRVRLEMLLQRLLERTENLNTLELEQLRELITEAAHLDVLAAMMLLGKSLREREPTTAFNWYSAAAAKGNATAYTQLGLMLSNGEGIERADLAKSVVCFQLAAEMNDPAAKTALAECYMYGKGVEKDLPRAIELLKDASDQGNVRAMDRLGTCYHKGTGVEQNYAEALRLFSKAAERGYGVAMGNLGVLHINGDGVPPNPVRAVELFEKGAKLGDGYCMFLYARCLESGTGVGRNKLQAQSWYQKAAEIGYPAAVEWCEKNDVPVPKKGK